MSTNRTQPLIFGVIRTFLVRHWVKIFILCLWIGVISLYWRVASDVAPTLEDKIHLLADWFMLTGWGPLLFIFVFTVQPLVFFPSLIMSILSGLFYGPVWGMVISVVGLNLAATVTYGVARLVGGDAANAARSNRWVQRYYDQLESNTFATLLTLHLLYAPFDLLNYLAGFMKLKWRDFAPATALGTLPSGLAYVLFGNSLGSLDQIAAGNPQINVPLLVFSLALAVGAYIGTRYMRRNKTPRPVEATSKVNALR